MKYPFSENLTDTTAYDNCLERHLLSTDIPNKDDRQPTTIKDTRQPDPYQARGKSTIIILLANWYYNFLECQNRRKNCSDALEIVPESDMEYLQSADCLEEMDTGEDSEESIGEHLAFLDNLDCTKSDPARQCTYVTCDVPLGQLLSKKTIKMYHKISKKSRKLIK